jgi:hypothetical protein
LVRFNDDAKALLLAGFSPLTGIHWIGTWWLTWMWV